MKVRKKPVIVDAIVWSGENSSAIQMWNRSFEDVDPEPSDIIDYTRRTDADAEFNGILIIPTMEGDMIARAGWWIIRGVLGEYYPCDPDVFKLTYEIVA